MTRPSPRQPIVAVLNFGCDLMFAREVAGATIRVLIGGHGYYLILADVHEQSGPDAADVEPIRSGVGPPLQSLRDEMAEPGYWGHVAAWRDGVVTGFIAARGFLVGNVPPSPDALAALYEYGARLQHAIEGWRSVFLDWIEIGLEVSVRENQSMTRQAGTGVIRAWGMGDDGVAYIGGGPINVLVRWPHPIDLDLWVRALAAASKGLTLPIEWGFIRDAQAAFQSFDHRRAVLDAATAAEIAMTKVLDQHLVSSTPEAAGLIRKRYRQINGLRDALANFGVQLPDGVNNKLAQPRNGAIHSGVVPTRETTQTAITIAREVVEQASPRVTLF